MTHLAFAYFAEQKVDVAVVEVGLGGRLDATNILTPAACGVANISYDHMAILGNTLEQIAREKAGIFKPGIPAVLAPQRPEVLRVLKECAANAGAPVECVGAEIQVEALPLCGGGEWPLPRALARWPGGQYGATLGLRGEHQLENWVVALRLADLFCLKKYGKHISQQAVERGSLEVSWPGRLEKISTGTGTAIYLDGAHNTHSLETVLRELCVNLPNRTPLVCVFGCARDKDATGMLNALARPSLGTDEVIFTDSQNPRSAPPQELLVQWKSLTNREAEVQTDCIDAMQQAIKKAGKNGAVLATGSLYLVGKIKNNVGRALLPA